MKPLDLLAAKRTHLTRLANQRGASGEAAVIASMENWTARPKGAGLKILLGELLKTGVEIRASSFDAISLPAPIDFKDAAQVSHALPSMVFIEIKTANQKRVKPGFHGFFFALTESEIAAAEQLGDRHRVALYNAATFELVLTSVSEIIGRARSMTWQLSVQL